MSIRAGLYSLTNEHGVSRVCVTLVLSCDLIVVVTLDLELMVVVCALKIWRQYFRWVKIWSVQVISRVEVSIWSNGDEYEAEGSD
jgi:hypothetical protein